ncbi:UNVERIFIED_CONTAM: hypothetical protein PYX00_011278 [Menopon gallinae]|uniref:Diphthine--ammonia ligase n=1 Tax=Menopon gallinae TaxID=328185 RepID=A0AAW2H7C3_9NEOP
MDEGHHLVGLLYVYCETSTVDSFMFQTVGKEMIEKYSACMGVPLFLHRTRCIALNRELEYDPVVGDEVEDLYQGVRSTLSKVDFEAVSSGAILSVYQKNRVESVCRRLGLQSLTPLLQMDQRELLSKMIAYGIDARVVKVAGGDLSKEALNKDLRYVRDCYNRSRFKDINYCGEGGEYETMVVDAPHFLRRIEILSFKVHGHEDEIGKCPNVFFMVVEDAHNQDYLPSRFILQKEAVTSIIGSMLQNSENSVGVAPLAQPEHNYILTPTCNKSHLDTFISKVRLDENLMLESVFQRSRIALMSRQESDKRMLVFFGTDMGLQDSDGVLRELVHCLRKAASSPIRVSAVLFGEHAALVKDAISREVGGPETCEAVAVGPDDDFFSSVTKVLGMGLSELEDDPELALALSMSLAESKQRPAQERT